MKAAESPKLGRPTRVTAGVLGVVLLVTGVGAVVMMAQAFASGRREDLLYLTGGLFALPCGLLMLRAARTGRDPL